MIRVGFGYDLHRLKEGDGLTLGGVRVPCSKTAVGHSDADVLIHAIIDALLGAAGLGDIGSHFPSGNPEFKNISSRVLLRRSMALVKEEGWSVVNIDSTVILQHPQLGRNKALMEKNVASDLSINEMSVSVKAKTKEHVDAAGEERAIEAYSVALLVADNADPVAILQDGSEWT